MRRPSVRTITIWSILTLVALSVWLITRQYQLHWAAHRGDITHMHRLLARGANPNATVFRGPSGYRGSTPLIYAIEGRQPEAIRVLAAAGANLDAPPPPLQEPVYYRAPPLLWALHFPELTLALLESGADPNVRTRDGEPLLSYALFLGQWESAIHMVRHGADVNARWDDGRSILHGFGYRAFLARHELIPVLLEHGIEPDTRFGRDQSTLLMLCARHDNCDFLQLLLDAGADPTLADTRGKTAVDHAREREDDGRETVIQLLLEVAR